MNRLDKITPTEKVICTHFDIFNFPTYYYVLTQGINDNEYHLYTFVKDDVVKDTLSISDEVSAMICMKGALYLIVKRNNSFVYLEYDWNKNLIETHEIDFPDDLNLSDYNNLNVSVSGDTIIYTYTSEDRTKILVYSTLDDLVMNKTIDGVHECVVVGRNHVVIGNLLIDTRHHSFKEYDINTLNVLKHNTTMIEHMVDQLN